MSSRNLAIFILSGFLSLSLIGNAVVSQKNVRLKASRKKIILDADSSLSVRAANEKTIMFLREDVTNLKGENDVASREIIDLKNLLASKEGYITELSEDARATQSLKAEVRKLNAKNESLSSELANEANENILLKNGLIENARELDKTKFQRDEAIAKLEWAKNISIENLVIRYFKTRRKKDKLVATMAKTDKITIQFDLGENPAALPGAKTIYLVITDPNNNVLHGKENMLNGKYTLAKTVNYTSDSLRVNMEFLATEKLNRGPYTAEFYIDNQTVGKQVFILW